MQCRHYVRVLEKRIGRIESLLPEHIKSDDVEMSVGKAK